MDTHQLHSSQLTQWVHNLPKAELHLHLEGAIPIEALWGLIQKYGGDPSVASKEELVGRLTYETFPDFIETWIWKNGFLRTYDDFQFIAESIARDLLRQNIIETYSKNNISDATINNENWGNRDNDKINHPNKDQKEIGSNDDEDGDWIMINNNGQ